MMTSYFNLLKYAATGQASPDMTYYDRMRASTLMGGATVQTLTGIPPLSFPSDGSPITIWSMIGNGEQTGTPSPQSIIMPTFCGVRTANLFDKSTAVWGEYINEDGTVTQEGSSKTAWLSDFISVKAGETYTLNRTGSRRGKFFKADKTPYQTSTMDFSGLENKNTFTIPETVAYIRFTIYKGYATPDVVMLNSGSAVLPYEPYGWAEKITCAGQTVPVYLGEVPTVRRIRKLVLTGQETDWRSGGGGAYMITTVSTGTVEMGVSSHFAYGAPAVGNGKFNISNLGTVSNLRFASLASGMSADDFKQWVSEQYAAGTPVTIWYVLATEQTGIVNEPLCKIGDYADELSSTDAAVTIQTIKGQNTLTVDTPIQPSEMTITFKG